MNNDKIITLNRKEYLQHVACLEHELREYQVARIIVANILKMEKNPAADIGQTALDKYTDQNEEVVA